MTKAKEYNSTTMSLVQGRAISTNRILIDKLIIIEFARSSLYVLYYCTNLTHGQTVFSMPKFALELNFQGYIIIIISINDFRRKRHIYKHLGHK